MKLTIIAVGRLKDGPERELVARYCDRARDVGRSLGFSGPDIVELAESRASRAADRKAEEAKLIRDKTENAVLIALDETGSSPSSAEFARQVESIRDSGAKALAFVIGGADGLDPDLVATAQRSLAFGAMTLPHQIVRIVLAEQVYRAMTVMSGHPYHRA